MRPLTTWRIILLHISGEMKRVSDKQGGKSGRYEIKAAKSVYEATKVSRLVWTGTIQLRGCVMSKEAVLYLRMVEW